MYVYHAPIYNVILVIKVAYVRRRLSYCYDNCFFQAPCEAEAQCAAMVKAGVVYATATEDMDSLTFGSNIMLRHLTASEAK